ncbi:MAG: DUF2628 domain-containing protein [Rhodospirillales bacterium]|nr:DUF2628 domain-containing protein [Rhodospirillales bacterium]MDE0381087.1 DUF2628 domain-containing protein [Rhodospirillales bacterium]
MRFYTVHLPASDEGADGGALGHAILVREGFNWLAFFFAPFWALAEGLWLAALALIVSLSAIIVVPLVLDLGPMLPAILGLGYGVLAGMSGNDLRRAGLAARGYRLVEVVAAPSRAQALIRYAEATMAAPMSQPAPAPSWTPAPGRRGLDPDPGFWS